MRPPRQIPQQVLDTLAQGGVVLCANARAARALSREYGEWIVARQSRRAWETPRILDWTQWLHEQWQQLLLTGKEDRVLLSSLQEEVLWNEIVKPTVEQRSLITPADIARLSMTAYALIVSYNATNRLQRSDWDDPTLEPELFRKWAVEMERRCERRRWLCEAKLPKAITEALEDGRLPAPAAIAWNGFDRITPVDKSIRTLLEHLGCRQQDVTWRSNPTERLLAAPSAANELEACAVWTRLQLEENPADSVGILLPNLEGMRAEVDRVFRRVLSPQADGLTEHDPKPVYEFTLGLPLADVPNVSAAMALLRWCIQPQPQETITWLMTSGFFGGDAHPANTAALAEADSKMRKKLTVPELEMNDALDRLSKYSGASGGNWTVANWVRRMRRAQGALVKSLGRQQSCAQWVSVVGVILKDAGWSGYGKDSIGYQVYDRWQRALDEISALSMQDRRYEYSEFLDLFDAHLHSSIFSPESTGAPVTVSGILESAGRRFDAVWVLSVTDTAWPALAHLHPLLPSWLQIELEMPGSSAQQTQLFASSVLDRLRDSAAELVFSYSKEGTEGAQRPSALIANIPAENTDSVSYAAPVLVEPFTDEMVVPWPGGRAAGGQEVIKNQSACPFKAFAGKRLGAKELPSLEAGLNALERGTIVHNVLWTTWSDERMRDSANLRSLIVAGKLAALIDQHVATAFADYDLAASTAWEVNYLRLEKERVCKLVEQWLKYEDKRQPFAVEQSEKDEFISVSGLDLRIRMDRVDAVSGGRVLIDYKTGKVKSHAWQGDRPSEPQLPIYAVSGKVEELRDVLFAQVRPDEIKYLSSIYKSKPDIFPENPPRSDAKSVFNALCEQWTAAIHSLSFDFQRGIATVTPKDYPQTCTYCDFPGLCRVAESSHAPEDDGDDEASL
jgi:probable DNA repair protein